MTTKSRVGDPIEDGIRATYEGRMQDIDAAAVFAVLVEEALPIFNEQIFPRLPHAAFDPLVDLVHALEQGGAFDKNRLRDFLVAISSDRGLADEIVKLLPDRASTALALLFAHLRPRSLDKDPIQEGARAVREGRPLDIYAEAVFAILLEEAPHLGQTMLLLAGSTRIDLRPLTQLVRASMHGQVLDTPTLSAFVDSITVLRDPRQFFVALPSDRARTAFSLLCALVAERHKRIAAPEPPPMPPFLDVPEFSLRYFSLLQFAGYWRGSAGIAGFLVLNLLLTAAIFAFAPFVWLAGAVTGMFFAFLAHIAPAIRDRDHYRGGKPCPECKRIRKAHDQKYGLSAPIGQSDPACHLPDLHWVAIRGCLSITLIPFLWPLVFVAGLLPERVMMRVFVLTMKYAHARADAAKDTNGKSSP